MTKHRKTRGAARRANAARPLRVLPLLISCALTSGAALAQTSATEQWVPGRLLVQPKPGLAEAELEKILKPHGGKSIGKIDAIGVHIVQLPPNASEKAVAALLGKNPHLKFAERDMLVKPEATANDPYFGSEWHLAKIVAPTAWDSSTGAGVTIAILDTGVDGTHPDLTGKLVPGWNFYDNNADTSDGYGHGTMVAGTAAAATNNGLGVAGVAGGAMIMPIRISDPSGYGSWSAMASGITWAADQGVKVANMSYAVSGSSTIQSAAQYLKNKGGNLVVGAGNSGALDSSAASSTMISVSATDSSDAKASWSSYGNYVDLAAPGVNIIATMKGGGYCNCNGTSFSSPVTAGVVALMKAANPSLGPADVESLLFSTAQDLGTAGWDMHYGYGRVNAAAAVQAAKTAVARDSTAPTVSLTAPASGATVSGLVAVNINANDNVGVTRVDLAVNGTQLASDTTSPYGFSWDSTKVANGNATLTAYAYDAAGNYTSSSLTVKVGNAVSTTTDTVAPSASITSPGNGAKVVKSTKINASASDDVGVASMSLYVDGRLVASANGASLSYTWNTAKVAAGNHAIQITAQDAAGNLGSQSIQVTK